MINPKHVRYIKLGKAGRWEDIALSSGELHLGHSHIPHSLAETRNPETIQLKAFEHRQQHGAATDDAREVMDFYNLGEDCLWITFSRGRMWWGFAETNVKWIGPATDEHGARTRKVIGGWKDSSTDSTELATSSLSSRLTKTSSYRRSICRLGSSVAEYAIRRINGTVEPIIAEAEIAKANLAVVTQRAIEALHWKDFEILTDLIFARSGWNRTSPVGGTQKAIDLLLEQPTTGEIATVQVKTSADQATFDQCVADFEADGTSDRFFFISHSPVHIIPPDDERIRLWAGPDLAKTVTRLGLHEWVFEKIR